MCASTSQGDTAAVTGPEDPLLIEIWRRLQAIEDPCHALSNYPLTIADLGIINRIDVAGELVEVGLTYTELGCTFAPHIVGRIEDELLAVPGVKDVIVVYEPFPPWSAERLSERARQVYAERKAQSLHGRAAASAEGTVVRVPFPAARAGSQASTPRNTTCTFPE